MRLPDVASDLICFYESVVLQTIEILAFRLQLALEALKIQTTVNNTTRLAQLCVLEQIQTMATELSCPSVLDNCGHGS